MTKEIANLLGTKAFNIDNDYSENFFKIFNACK